MGTINFSKFIENRIANIQASDSFAFAAAIGLGPWLCPLAPAIVFGYALFVSAPADMAEFRAITAVAVAIGLIVAGAVSSHNAIISGGWRPWSLVFGYIGLEIIGLWLMTVRADVKVVGTVASLLTLIVYLSRSTAKEREFQIEQARLNAEHKRQLAEQAATLEIEEAKRAADHQRHMEEQDAALKHDERMARIEAKPKAQPAGKLPEPSDENGKLPEWLPVVPENLNHFRQLVGSGAASLPADLSGAELGRIIGRSPRTGQNWLTGVRNGNSSG